MGLLSIGDIVKPVENLLPDSLKPVVDGVAVGADILLGNEPGAIKDGMALAQTLDDRGLLPTGLTPLLDAAKVGVDLYSGDPKAALSDGLKLTTDLTNPNQQNKDVSGSSGALIPTKMTCSVEPDPPSPLAGKSLSPLTPSIASRLPTTTSPSAPSVSHSDGKPPVTLSSPSALAASDIPSTSTESASSAESSSAAASGSADDFFGLSDEDFMKRLRSGDIPKDITDDPKAMLAIQARMSHIAEMNQLMTQMMQAMHQMNIAIIQNVRV